MSEPEKVEGIVTIPGPSRDYLSERELIAYRNHRKDLLKWLARLGKNPDTLEGYAHDTAKCYATILDKFHRWAWEKASGYTLDIAHADADAYLRGFIMGEEDYSDSHLHNVKLALKAYFRYREDRGEWESDLKVRSTLGVSQPKDYVSMDERKALREAAIEFGSIPAYAGLEPRERREWKMHLAQRFGKPVDDVSPKDWDRANGFKYPSIVHTSLDAGLRPVEVERAKTYWVDFENAALRIPEKDASKNEGNWTVSLTRETTEFLARWLQEREMYEKDDNTEALWLTRHGNPYGSSSLRYLMENLREIAGIDRHLSWYAIRHSTGTYMAREEDLAAAQSQLRHKRVETTMKYDQAPVEDRRKALDKMG